MCGNSVLLRQAQSMRTAKFDPRKCSRKCTRECTRRCPRKCPRRLRLFLRKTHQRVPTKTPTRVLTGKLSSAHGKFSSAHENVHESVLGQNFAHVLFSHVLFLGQMFFSWWTFRIFYFFSGRERGRGVWGDREGGGRLFIEISGRGCGLPRGEGGEGAGRVSAGSWGGGKGVAFFFAAEMPAKFLTRRYFSLFFSSFFLFVSWLFGLGVAGKEEENGV